jgi:hypothetical protein
MIAVRRHVQCRVANQPSLIEIVTVWAPMRAAAAAAVRIWQGPQRAEASLLAEHAGPLFDSSRGGNISMEG